MTTRSRLLMMVQPQPEVRARLWTAVSGNGLDLRLGARMFAVCYWHQTLSDRYSDSPSMRARMLLAGAGISSRACTLTLNRIRDRPHGDGYHWALLARGDPPCFSALLTACSCALAEQGLGRQTG
jgi:hypothetical protein